MAETTKNNDNGVQEVKKTFKERKDEFCEKHPKLVKAGHVAVNVFAGIGAVGAAAFAADSVFGFSKKKSYIDLKSGKTSDDIIDFEEKTEETMEA